MSFPDIPTGFGVPLVDLSDGLLPEPTMDALDARYVGGGAGLPAGGAAGQFLMKDTGTDYDVSWQDLPVLVPNVQTNTSYTPALTDIHRLVTLTNSSGITVTLPQDSDVNFPTGARVDFAGLGTGLVTFAAGTGATVVGTPSLVTRARYSAASAVKIGSNSWLVVGDLA